jgi:hypothetical protein
VAVAAPDGKHSVVDCLKTGHDGFRTANRCSSASMRAATPDGVSSSLMKGALPGVAFAIGLFASAAMGPIINLVVGPAIEGSPRPVGASDSILFWASWGTAFVVFGALVGLVIAGRRGNVGFALAFLVFLLAGLLLVVVPQDVHDHVPHFSRTFERAFRALAVVTVYPLAFAAAGAIGMGVATQNRAVAWTAAKNGAFNGFIGALTLAGLIVDWGLSTPFFIASLAIPAFLGGRRLRALFVSWRLVQ